MASSTEEGTPSQEQGQQERDPSLCIAIKNDHNLCSNRAQDGFQTCGIKPHREQDPSEMQGVIGEKDDGTCIASKKDGERCQNPAHEGFVTCGIAVHRKELQDQMSVAKSQEPIRVVSPAAAFQGGAEAPGQENADQTPKSSQLQSLGSGNDGRLPSQFSYPLKRDGQVPAAATQEKPPRARSTPDTRAQSAISVPGDNRAEGPGLEQPRIFGSLNPGRGRSPSLGPNMPPPLPNGDWEFLRADIRGFLAAIVSDNRESLQINFGNLCTTANAHMAETQRQLTAQLVDSLSYFRGEQIKKEEMMTQQLNAFNQGIAALQQSFHALSLAHKDTHTTLQQDYKGLAQKVDMLVSRDQQVTDTLNESLHHHHSQMDALMKSHSNTLLAAFKQPHRVLGDDHKSLEQKLDAVLHSNQHLANQIDALMNSHSATLSATNPAHQSMLEDTHKKLDDKVDTIIMYDRELREHIHTTFQKLPGLRNTSLITQQQSYDLRDDHRKLGEKMSLLFDNDQAMDRSLTEKFEDHNARFEATFESNFNKLIVSHQQACETLEGGQRKLEDKIDAIARDDHGRLATDVVDDLTNQRQTLIKELTAMMDGFSNLETFIHHFCLQMQIALPGNEDSKDLRRRQADQYEYLEKLKNEFILTYGDGKEAVEEEFIPASGSAQREIHFSRTP